jgi:hypothetical protein
MASKCVDVENADDDEQPEDDEAEDKEEGDSVRTASTTVASLWTSHQTHRRLLQKHFLVNLKFKKAFKHQYKFAKKLKIVLNNIN